MLDFLTKPITDLAASLGSGTLPSGGPTDLLRAASSTLDTASAIGRIAVNQLGTGWSGDAANAAIIKAEQVTDTAIRLAENGNAISDIVSRASESVRSGSAELDAILQSLIGIAISAAPVLLTPVGQTMLIAAAVDHLERAMTVVARVQAELAATTAEAVLYITPVAVPQPAHSGGVAAPVIPTLATGGASAPSLPGSDALTNFARTFASSAGSMLGPSSNSGFDPFSATAAPSDDRGASGTADRPSYDPRTGGKGVSIRLPDGSTAVAPNEQAAGAVRSALTQTGVPYSWGGTQPGRGLDCSGLTQWAYGEEGVELPRLAQEQGVGASVAPDEVMPGDLAVWDGHVAMVVGNGQMIEAGNPVELSPIRTSNSGMGFHGFYRPTEA